MKTGACSSCESQNVSPGMEPCMSCIHLARPELRNNLRYRNGPSYSSSDSMNANRETQQQYLEISLAKEI